MSFPWNGWKCFKRKQPHPTRDELVSLWPWFREGICRHLLHVHQWGSAWFQNRGLTTCSVTYANVQDGDTITNWNLLGPSLSVIKDSVVRSHSSFWSYFQQADGFIGVNTSGNTKDANAIPIGQALRPHNGHGFRYRIGCARWCC